MIFPHRPAEKGRWMWVKVKKPLMTRIDKTGALGKDVCMNRAHEKQGVEPSAKYLDVKFECLVHDLEMMVTGLRDQIRELSDHDRLERLKDICRAIRATKLHFHKVLERYGANYEDSANHFVDLAYLAADMADQTDSDKLKKSLKRHAEEIQKARSAVTDVCQGGNRMAESDQLLIRQLALERREWERFFRHLHIGLP